MAADSDTFRARVTAAIDSGWCLTVDRGFDAPPERHSLAGDLIAAVLGVETIADARAFHRDYLAYLRATLLERDDHEAVARSNIGWCFGEGMGEERLKMWVEACDAAHPVFGQVIPSPSEALRLGYEYGRSGRDLIS